MNGISKDTLVGFVGLGVMGKSMARNLLKAGLPTTVFNRSSKAARELAAEGAQVAASPGALAAAVDVIGLCLPDTPDVEAVLFGPDGLASGLRPGAVVIDFSTISAPATVDFAVRLKARGVDMLDSPVSGGPKGAADGTLSCMIGGDEQVLVRCMPVFEAVGKSFTHVGPSGAGQLCKSCNQLVVCGTLMAVLEALTLARKSGIDPHKVRDALLGGSAQSFVLQNHAKRFLDGQVAPGFRTSLMLKDLRLAHSAARDAGSFAPVASLAEQLLAAMVNTGRADLDSSAMGQLFGDLSGTQTEGPRA